MGKAYANRKKVSERPDGDLYETPRPLTWELIKLKIFDFNKTVLEPAEGNGAITDILNNYFYVVYSNDISYHEDFLNYERWGVDNGGNLFKPDYIITNPPFSKFDAFVLKAKEVVKEKVVFIGKLNFFGAYQRIKKGVWKNLSDVYIFNRQVDYRFFREDDKLIAGNLVTGWFVWDKNWDKDYWRTHIIDVQKYMISNRS